MKNNRKYTKYTVQTSSNQGILVKNCNNNLDYSHFYVLHWRAKVLVALTVTAIRASKLLYSCPSPAVNEYIFTKVRNTPALLHYAQRGDMRHWHLRHMQRLTMLRQPNKITFPQKQICTDVFKDRDSWKWDNCVKFHIKTRLDTLRRHQCGFVHK